MMSHRNNLKDKYGCSPGEVILNKHGQPVDCARSRAQKVRDRRDNLLGGKSHTKFAGQHGSNKWGQTSTRARKGSNQNHKVRWENDHVNYAGEGYTRHPGKMIVNKRGELVNYDRHEGAEEGYPKHCKDSDCQMFASCSSPGSIPADVCSRNAKKNKTSTRPRGYTVFAAEDDSEDDMFGDEEFPEESSFPATPVRSPRNTSFPTTPVRSPRSPKAPGAPAKNRVFPARQKEFFSNSEDEAPVGAMELNSEGQPVEVNRSEAAKKAYSSRCKDSQCVLFASCDDPDSVSVTDCPSRKKKKGSSQRCRNSRCGAYARCGSPGAKTVEECREQRKSRSKKNNINNMSHSELQQHMDNLNDQINKVQSLLYGQ